MAVKSHTAGQAVALLQVVVVDTELAVRSELKHTQYLAGTAVAGVQEAEGKPHNRYGIA